MGPAPAGAVGVDRGPGAESVPGAESGREAGNGSAREAKSGREVGNGSGREAVLRKESPKRTRKRRNLVAVLDQLLRPKEVKKKTKRRTGSRQELLERKR